MKKTILLYTCIYNIFTAVCVPSEPSFQPATAAHFSLHIGNRNVSHRSDCAHSLFVSAGGTAGRCAACASSWKAQGKEMQVGKGQRRKKSWSRSGCAASGASASVTLCEAYGEERKGRKAQVKKSWKSSAAPCEMGGQPASPSFSSCSTVWFWELSRHPVGRADLQANQQLFSPCQLKIGPCNRHALCRGSWRCHK